MTTKTDAQMAADEERFADDPERVEMLRCVRRFKTSWLELGEALTRIRRSNHWKTWGYETFEAYAKNELRLRQDTVDKLTGSFVFLQKRAPEVLDRESMKGPVPSYQAIDYLRRAEEQEDAPKDVVRALYTKVMDEGTSLPKLKKEFESTVFPLAPQDKKARDQAGIRNVASRLRALLGESDAVPKRLAARVNEVLDELLTAVEQEKAA